MFSEGELHRLVWSGDEELRRERVLHQRTGRQREVFLLRRIPSETAHRRLRPSTAVAIVCCIQGDPEKRCNDTVECDMGVKCPFHSVCVNTPGSYDCVCEKGYRMRDAVCEPIDQCAEAAVSKSSEPLCGDGAVCVNKGPTYE